MDKQVVQETFKNLREEDPEFEQECPECHGYGWVQSKEWDDYSDQIFKYAEKYIKQRMNRKDAVEKALKEIEPPCGPKEVPCWVCNGEGIVRRQ